MNNDVAIEPAKYGRVTKCLNDALLYLDTAVTDEYVKMFYHLSKNISMHGTQ